MHKIDLIILVIMKSYLGLTRGWPCAILKAQIRKRLRLNKVKINRNIAGIFVMLNRFMKMSMIFPKQIIIS